MTEKLKAGDTFPSMTLRTADGGAIQLPAEPDAKYRVILFYRGHW
jgi:peroxiredoxin